MAKDQSKYYEYQQNFRKEHYKAIATRLTYGADDDLLKFVEQLKDDGVSLTMVIKDGLRRLMADKDYIDSLKTKK